MKCPFCGSKLEVWTDVLHTVYGCAASGCVNDDMPRYMAKYNNYPTYLVSKTFMMDDLYIQVDYKQNYTIIHRLEACCLFDSVQIPRALDVSMKNPKDIIPKIRILMTFS